MCSRCGCEQPLSFFNTETMLPAHASGQSVSKTIPIEQALMTLNNAKAQENRLRFRAAGQLALNLVSSPGSGKTTLLVKTIQHLHPHLHMVVVEGDQQSECDAERIRATGVEAVQIQTGKACHLDAGMISDAVRTLKPPSHAVVWIENVGNLVCPADFDLGERHKVLILSVTEGEDKALKYPHMFRAADILLISKVDLLPYVPFDMEQCMRHALSVNPRLEIMPLSATSGSGMQCWLDWLERSALAAAS